MNKIAAIIRIIRPVNFAITFASIITAGFISCKNLIDLTVLILAAFSGGFAVAAGNVINDIFDLKIDKINRPERVLPSGELSVNEALILYIILCLAAIVTGMFINITAITIVLISVIIIFFYSQRLKKIPLIGNIVVSSFTGIAFIYGAVAVDNWVGGVIPAVFAFFINLIREIVKDIEDLEGDSKAGVYTFPAIRGIPVSITLIKLLTITLILLTTIPFLLKIYRIEYFVLVMPVVNGIFVYFLRKLSEDQSKVNLRKMSNLLKINMVVGLLAIFLGNY